jgi:archaeosortase C (PEF-CTERM variant)
MRIGTQRFKFILGLILLLAGLEIAVTLTYIARWIGVILMIFGLGILVITARKRPDDDIIKEREESEIEQDDEKTRNLADVLITKLTLNGKINPFLPVIGCALIIFVYIFNFTVRKNMDLGVNDTITVLLGACLAFYNYVPKKFDRERDFVLIFLIFLFLILVLPLTLYSIVNGPIVENSNSPFIYYLLANPTSDMLNLMGIPASAHSIPPSQIVNGIQLSTSGVPIVYENIGADAETQWSTVMIGISCTGLYSVSIFISGFIAFILIEYGRLDIRVASLLSLGIFASWFANILRMTIIVAVGSHYGGEALRWTHENAGIFIFMLWVGLFWAVMFKILVPKKEKNEGDSQNRENGKDNTKSGDILESSDIQNP